MVITLPRPTCPARIDAGRGRLRCVYDDPHPGHGHYFVASDAPDRHIEGADS